MELILELLICGAAISCFINVNVEASKRIVNHSPTGNSTRKETIFINNQPVLLDEEELKMIKDLSMKKGLYLNKERRKNDFLANRLDSKNRPSNLKLLADRKTWIDSQRKLTSFNKRIIENDEKPRKIENYLSKSPTTNNFLHNSLEENKSIPKSQKNNISLPKYQAENNSLPNSFNPKNSSLSEHRNKTYRFVANPEKFHLIVDVPPEEVVKLETAQRTQETMEGNLSSSKNINSSHETATVKYEKSQKTLLELLFGELQTFGSYLNRRTIYEDISGMVYNWYLWILDWFNGYRRFGGLRLSHMG